MRPRIYIAGPFRGKTPWDIECNIRQAEDHGLRVAMMGGIPIIPHSMYRFFQDSLPDDFWLEAGLSILQTCHAVSVCVSPERAEFSKGTMAEVQEAQRLGLPVFTCCREMLLELARMIDKFSKKLEGST